MLAPPLWSFQERPLPSGLKPAAAGLISREIYTRKRNEVLHGSSAMGTRYHNFPTSRTNTHSMPAFPCYALL